MKITALIGITVTIAVLWLGLASPAGAQVPDSTCLGCHDGYDRTLDKTVHRLAGESSGKSVSVHCIKCHEGGETHIAEPSKDNITNPANLSGDKALTLCSTCHNPHPAMDSYGMNAHNLQRLNCSSCHSIHSGTPTLLRDAKALFCLNCHSDTKAQFSQRSMHPVNQGVMTCLSCHKFVQQRDNPQAYDANRVCQDCHSDVTGPYLYEHPVVNAYDVNGSGCTECHKPHGSENDHLLTQPGNQLCLQCHAVPGHTTNHNGVYANLSCMTCHTDIHGSFTNRSLLSPDLGAKFGQSCYCHGLN